ncbi:hypothetical protein P692DRAFT_20273194 [Suillus brevipes Sb2]|nr:hypothetical protein P692DRAFT_20273194 [Suillus brevipes Sb2]
MRWSNGVRIGTEHRSGVQVPHSGQACRLSMNSVVVSKAEGIIILYPWNLINLADEKRILLIKCAAYRARTYIRGTLGACCDRQQLGSVQPWPIAHMHTSCSSKSICHTAVT